jgi:hypothetical protein
VPYETHLIADHRMGVDLNREPWISPAEAWRTMENAFPFRGRIWKRQGYGWFGELGYPIGFLLEPLGKSGLSSFTWTTANSPVCRCPNKDLLPTTYSIQIFDGTNYTLGVDAIVDDGEGNIVLADAPSGTKYGTIDYETGDIVISSLPWPIDGTGGWIDYRFLDQSLAGSPSENAVMGIDSFFPRAGGESLFAWDRRNMWLYNAAQEHFELIRQCRTAPYLDLWTGGPSNFFWTENFFSINAAGDDGLLIVNGVDPLYYWDAEAYAVGVTGPLKEVHTDWATPASVPGVPGETAHAGGYVRQIDSALMAFRFKNRVVLLNTVEGSDAWPQRARWSQVDPNFDSLSWNAEDWADADTSDWIVSATFFGDDLLVLFERSVWKLRWQDDFQEPFKWERLFETDGSFATMSTMDFTNEVITLSGTGMIATDGVDIDTATPQVPDITLEWNPEKFQFSYGIVIDEARQALISYAPAGEDYPTHAMCMQYEDNAVSFYNFGFHCYGYYQFESSLVWDDYPDDWDTYFFAWDEKTFQAGFPAVLSGDRDCRIFTLWSELSDWLKDPDDPGNIHLNLISNRLNPYVRKGRGCRLGFLTIIASTNADVTLKVSVYENFTGVAYLTKEIVLNGPGEKVRKRIPVFTDRAFHQIQIEETSSKLVRIDGIELTTKPTGPLRTI